MAKRTYLHLLMDLFDYLIAEWGCEERLIFKDQGDLQYRHDLGFICYKLDPKSLKGYPHTLGLKKINLGGLAGHEGLALAYWTYTPISDSEPQLILAAEKQRVGETAELRNSGEEIKYSLIIKSLQSFYGPGSGFDITWQGAEQVLGIIDRARKLSKSEEYISSTFLGSMEDLLDFTIIDNVYKRP